MTTLNPDLTAPASTCATEAVVRAHLQAFLEQRGVDAVVADYDDAAVFLTREALYRGRAEIHGFFTGFLAALPPGAIGDFSLTSMRIDGAMALITWQVGEEIPLGTDSFVVRDGKILAQTFAMHVASPGV